MEDYIKKNISNLKPSATLAINEKVKKLLKEGKKVFNFGFGQSPFPIPDKIVNVLKENAHKKDYLPMQGLSDLREAISRYLFKRTGVNYKKENIIITPGSKEAMLLMHVVFNGEIILPAPSWVSYEPQAEIAKNKVHWIETSIDNNWFPTAKQFEDKIKSIGKKNIILIINSPNNPSGSVCSNLKEIAKVAKKNNVRILSDEIYTDLTFDNKYESISQFCPENTFISGGLSKWCGAGGWRLGFFAVPTSQLDFLSALKTLASESYSTVNSPLQFAAVEAYKGDYSVYLKNTKSILKLVGNYVFNNLKSNKVLIHPPKGAFYLMPEFLNSKFSSSAEMCGDILNKTGVALLPGSDFGFKSNKMLARLSYTDFDGDLFLKNIDSSKKLDDDLVKKYAPNIVEGTHKLVEWSKTL